MQVLDQCRDVLAQGRAVVDDSRNVGAVVNVSNEKVPLSEELKSYVIVAGSASTSLAKSSVLVPWRRERAARRLSVQALTIILNLKPRSTLTGNILMAYKSIGRSEKSGGCDEGEGVNEAHLEMYVS